MDCETPNKKSKNFGDNPESTVSLEHYDGILRERSLSLVFLPYMREIQLVAKSSPGLLKVNWMRPLLARHPTLNYPALFETFTQWGDDLTLLFLHCLWVDFTKMDEEPTAAGGNAHRKQTENRGFIDFESVALQAGKFILPVECLPQGKRENGEVDAGERQGSGHLPARSGRPGCSPAHVRLRPKVQKEDDPLSSSRRREEREPSRDGCHYGEVHGEPVADSDGTERRTRIQR